MERALTNLRTSLNRLKIQNLHDVGEASLRLTGALFPSRQGDENGQFAPRERLLKT